MAIWNDRTEAIADLYEPWYVNQHFPERLGQPGWLLGRRYEAIDDAATPYFTYYRLDTTAAAFSEAYLARLNDPTPETVEIMAHMVDMTRTCCDIVYERGETTGALSVVARFYSMPDVAALEDVAAQLWRGAQRDGALRRACPLRVQVWQAVAAEAPDTNERKVRPQPDREARAALVVDVMRDVDARAVQMTLSDSLRTHQLTPDYLDSYRLLCERGA